MNKMSQLGIRTELNKAKRSFEPPQTRQIVHQYIPGTTEEEEEPVGLLQVERKYVYTTSDQPKTRKRGAGGDGSSDEDDSGSDEMSDHTPLREADKDALVKAYKYGATLVPIDEDDEEAIRQSFEPSLEIRGFVRLKDVSLCLNPKG